MYLVRYCKLLLLIIFILLFNSDSDCMSKMVLWTGKSPLLLCYLNYLHVLLVSTLLSTLYPDEKWTPK